MKQKSLIYNAIFNFLYTGLNLLFPLITAPYVSRVLGASNLGQVNLATTIVSWFILFATYGTATYGVREIARARDDKEKRSTIFSELVVINAMLSFIVLIIYFLAIFNIPNFYNELPLYLIMSSSILLNMFAIDWYFQGIEEYRYITIRSAIFKSISLVCIFLFVSQPSHYVIYGLISVLATSLSGILNYIYSKKSVRMKFRGINPFRHFKGLNVFFFHTLIVSIYTNLDQILLGFFIDTKAVAFMNRSKVLINMAVTVSTAISNVTLPRASYYKDNDEEKFRYLLSAVPNYILWVTIPITVSFIVFSSKIMFILGGSEFLEAGVLLQVMSLTIICSPLSGYLQYQVLVASGKERIGLYVAVITSLISLTLNLILIPKIGILGAGFVQVLSELLAVSIRLYIAKYRLNYREIIFLNKSTITYLCASILMGGVMILISRSIQNIFLSFAVGILLGGIVYIFTLFILREKVTRFLFGKLFYRFKN
ncbi:flippase [Paenibacillus sp. NPDC056722]|uniref:flippase n=1 Tax=Paenibacillus sp. NPDC056722 TaxID=3345924 RepID=UPI0036C2E807